MDHKTFISGLSRQIGKDYDETDSLVEALTQVIREDACNLDAVAIPGFGRFNAIKTDEHISEDDEGRKYLYPPHISVEFIAGSKLKKRL